MKLFYRISFLAIIIVSAIVGWSNKATLFTSDEKKQPSEKKESVEGRKNPSSNQKLAIPSVDTIAPGSNQPMAATTVSAIKTVDKSSAVAGDTLTYSVTIKSTGADTAFGLNFTDVVDANTTVIPDSLRYSPLAFDDAYTSVGNVGISVPAANGVLLNDYKGLPLATLLPIASRSTVNGGTIAVAADGSFTYTPGAGFVGTDTVRYIIENKVKKDTGVISITMSSAVWFINNTYAGSVADGRMTTPFKSVAAFQAVNNGTGNNPKANHTIFLHESATAYDGNITLLNGQKLIGQDATTTIQGIAGFSLPPYSLALPVLNSANGTIVNLTTTAASTNAVTLASSGSNYVVRGLSIGNKTGAGISGTNFGTLAASEINISGTGQALVLATGALTGSFGTLSSTSGNFGISLTTVSGSLTATSGALSGNTTGLFVTGSNATITYPGNIGGTRPVDIQARTGNTITLSGNITSTNLGINIVNNTGGTILFSGTSKSLSTGANPAVTLTNNTGATVNFSNGGLVINTTTGAGINATGGAAVLIVTGTGNQITSAGGTALNVANTTIGGGGLVFQSIAANGGAKGISLNNTGSTAGLTVTGVGTTAGSGGTIQNISARGIEIVSAGNISLSNMNLTNANTADNGVASELDNINNNAAVYLGTVNTVSLNRINITTTAQQGLNANNVTALTIDNSSFTGNGNGVEEGALKLKDLKGTCNILNSTFSNAYYRIAHLLNTTGAMNLHVTNSVFQNTGTLSPIAQDCFEMRTRNAATATVVIAGSTFRKAGTKGLQVFAENTSVINMAVTNCTVDRQGGMMAGIEVGSDQSAQMFANVDGNPMITGTNEVSLNIYAGGTTASKTEATVRNNTNITGNGLGMYTDPTVQAFANQDGKAIVLINGNTITNSDDQAILTRATEGSGTMNATVQNNSITVPAPSFIGIEVRTGSDELTPYTNINCSHVRNNNVVNNGAYAFFVQTASPNTKVQLQGTAATVPALWTANTNTGSPADSYNVGGAQILIGSGYVCSTPTNLVAPTIAPPPADTLTEDLAVANEQQDSATVDPVNNSVETIDVIPAAASNANVTLSGETVSVSGINLPQSKTLIIQFKVRVDTPFPVNVCSVSNQGSVSGTNFPTVSTDNDGSTGNGINPTVTAINSAPAITVCQANIAATSATCNSTQSFAVTTTGCPAPTVTYTIQGPGTVITSPYAFPVGTTTVNVKASNGIGADATCSFTVTITGTNATWTGTTSSNWHTASNWSCATVPDINTNVTINSGAPNMPVISAAGAANNISLASGATLTLNTGNTLQVNGNFTSAGTFAANGNVNFVGSGVQTIPAATYNNLTISGGSNKNLAGNATINGTLTFSSGTISIGASNLVLGTSNTISGANNASYIVTNGSGSVKKMSLGNASGDYTFPVGYSASSYTPVTLNNAGTTDNFSVRIINNVYSSYAGGTTPAGSPIATGVVNKTWFVAEDVAGGSNATLTLQWNATDELPGFSRASSYVSHNSNGAWLAGPAGVAAGTDPYTRFRTNLTSFSPFGVGTSGSLLPVQLMTFKGSARGTANILEWSTTNEQLIRFEVERSTSRNNFTKLGEVTATGRTAINQYNLSDNAPLQGTNFYRLRMIHTNGTASYSSVINISRDGGQPTVTVYPSPVTGKELNVQLSGLKKGVYQASLFNGSGQLVQTTSISYDGGTLIQAIQLPANLSKGMYHLQVKKDDTQFNQSIIVQ